MKKDDTQWVWKLIFVLLVIAVGVTVLQGE